MDTTISRHPSEALPQGGPSVVVVAQNSVAPAELYRRGMSSPLRCAANVPVVALIRTPLLSSPDVVAAKAGEWTPSLLIVELEIRQFTGPLAANDPWIALVCVGLGSLQPAPYELALRTTVLAFSDLHHPESASGPSTTEQRFRFECN
jgi:hypothetical protein